MPSTFPVPSLSQGKLDTSIAAGSFSQVAHMGYDEDQPFTCLGWLQTAVLGQLKDLGGIDKNIVKEFDLRGRRLNTSMISAPASSSFTHVAHMGYNETEGFSSTGVDPSWTAALGQLEAPDTEKTPMPGGFDVGGAKLDESMITGPASNSFVHVAHMGYHESQGFTSTGVDPSWTDAFGRLEKSDADKPITTEEIDFSGGRLDKSAIAGPASDSFVHVAHVGYSENEGFTSTGVDASWMDALDHPEPRASATEDEETISQDIEVVEQPQQATTKAPENPKPLPPPSRRMHSTTGSTSSTSTPSRRTSHAPPTAPAPRSPRASHPMPRQVSHPPPPPRAPPRKPQARAPAPRPRPVLRAATAPPRPRPLPLVRVRPLPPPAPPRPLPPPLRLRPIPPPRLSPLRRPSLPPPRFT
ncbi:hypothetical protein DFH08DRAFT_1072679 [Mycena albidolilacea]|uniref:CRIB domain-containing protein n=1 Tax=Mycena albidolilacea TaxID=1033008 RepID=A0AAD7AMQ9_9AGAR|nr:hypothetical protein DFH08DRAFT_1072679 [Mycena albidolilacea]